MADAAFAVVTPMMEVLTTAVFGVHVKPAEIP
jgi:hypothetical protein